MLPEVIQDMTRDQELLGPSSDCGLDPLVLAVREGPRQHVRRCNAITDSVPMDGFRRVTATRRASVVLQQVRGRFDNGITRSSGKYHAAYANDSWAIGTHVTLNAGIRWEQQRLTGNVAFHTFTNMWSPRIGIIVDPKGDRKSKIYANFGRYAFVLPLDLALRSLSTESDFLNPYLCARFNDRGLPGRVLRRLA